jgi:hypothetical protein
MPKNLPELGTVFASSGSEIFLIHEGSETGFGTQIRLRNQLKSRIQIRIRIRKKSFRIHNTAPNILHLGYLGIDLFLHIP